MDNCKTGSFSRMASKCQKCPDRDTCNNKRMEALAYIIPSTPSMKEMEKSPCASSSVTINMQMPSIEKLNKEIIKDIAKRINICGFGELRR